MMTSEDPLAGWMPVSVLKLAVPLTEKYQGDNYVIHYYEGFDVSTAVSICEDMLRDVTLTSVLNIYLYIIDYPHDHTKLSREGSNNGYMQRVGNNYSIVIFRRLFWPKVLIHEILHVLWMLNNLPIVREDPRWDEAIIEAHAVRLAIKKNYINETEYKYYTRKSKDTIMGVCGGDIAYLRANQKTPLYEYMFLSEVISNLC